MFPIFSMKWDTGIRNQQKHIMHINFRHFLSILLLYHRFASETSGQNKIKVMLSIF